MSRVAVRPEMVSWALERAGLGAGDLRNKFPKLEAWERGEVQPTFKQLEDFADATRVPFGYLFLPEPPEEDLPIPDFRMIARHEAPDPSPDLLETIYTMQRRQAWLREDRRPRRGVEPCGFVVQTGEGVQKMMARITNNPNMLQRTRDRAGIFVGTLASRISKLKAWNCFDARPILRRHDAFRRSGAELEVVL